MIVIDSSAILAILFNEPDALAYATAIQTYEKRLISSSNVLEIFMVLQARRTEEYSGHLTAFLERYNISIIPFDASQLIIAQQAFMRFGKGRHVAGLNFGDCFAYALAKTHKAPLLYKGADFAKTDIISAIG